jgi:4-hydroxybenzoate polyprenyltransferase
MQVADNEKQFVLVAVGVVLFTILAIAVFLLSVNIIIFYICAVIAVGLGFYLSYNLSQMKPQYQQDNKKKK